jgi:flavin reductase (DIM6/NTAB) family NADH-FMN oxidoreductase RutF
MNAHAPGLINERDFRNALGLFATGVVIITAEVNGNKLGATVSSFNSVSLKPPLVLFSVAHSAYGLRQWRAANALAISVLAEHQTELSNRFAKSSGAKWKGLEERRAGNGAPLPPDVLLHFECRPYAVHGAGDHDIFVCEVTGHANHYPGRLPLLFFSGRYRRLAPEEGVRGPDENLWLHGW